MNAAGFWFGFIKPAEQALGPAGWQYTACPEENFMFVVLSKE